MALIGSPLGSLIFPGTEIWIILSYSQALQLNGTIDCFSHLAAFIIPLDTMRPSPWGVGFEVSSSSIPLSPVPK